MNHQMHQPIVQVSESKLVDFPGIQTVLKSHVVNLPFPYFQLAPSPTMAPPPTPDPTTSPPTGSPITGTSNSKQTTGVTVFQV